MIEHITEKGLKREAGEGYKLFYNLKTDFNQWNIEDQPIFKRYAIVYYPKALIITVSRNKYVVRSFGFIPKYHKENHIEVRYDDFFTLGKYDSEEEAVRMWKMYAKEMLGIEKKITMKDCINYLTEWYQLNEKL